MKRQLFIIGVTLILLAAAVVQSGVADDSGTFRGKWWNYYDRALAGADKEELASAEKDLRKALAMRERDQRMARTYGMHFIDYFPHRELGVVLYRRGDLAAARKELETSLGQAESAKAAYFLNKVRKGLFQQEGRRFPAPGIVIDEPAPGTTLAGLTVKVKGRVTAPGLVAGLAINRVKVAVELAREELFFEQEVQLEEGDEELTVTAEDLLGTASRQAVAFAVDRDGPVVGLQQVTLHSGMVHLTGQIEDHTGIRQLVVDGNVIVVGGVRSYPLDLTVPLHPGSRIEIRALDLLGNETIALCDPNQELAAFTPRRVLLAAAGPMALFDREPPTLTLRDSSELPAVFVD
ncbi:MAG TPA: hypothetical protein VIU41_06815, partial [Geobacteraceae bacterium]